MSWLIAHFVNYPSRSEAPPYYTYYISDDSRHPSPSFTHWVDRCTWALPRTTLPTVYRHPVLKNQPKTAPLLSALPPSLPGPVGGWRPGWGDRGVGKAGRLGCGRAGGTCRPGTGVPAADGRGTGDEGRGGRGTRGRPAPALTPLHIHIGLDVSRRGTHVEL